MPERSLNAQQAEIRDNELDRLEALITNGFTKHRDASPILDRDDCKISRHLGSCQMGASARRKIPKTSPGLKSATCSGPLTNPKLFRWEAQIRPSYSRKSSIASGVGFKIMYRDAGSIAICAIQFAPGSVCYETLRFGL